MRKRYKERLNRIIESFTSLFLKKKMKENKRKNFKILKEIYLLLNY